MGGKSVVIFTETELRGAYIIDLERRADTRGFFARTFCQHEFETHGLKPVIAQGFTRVATRPPRGRGLSAGTRTRPW